MPAPKIIGPYEIVELLGRGGMGEVYKAVDSRMYRRPVALKLLSEAMAADPRALSRFDLEIETAANLRHPNIVQIYDRGEFAGRRYFAMELLEGRDLGALIKERDARPLEARLEIIIQLCDALDYAHAHGVVHRDIKPANILVITRGGTDHVKLVDFGIVHVARGDHTRTVVQPGTMLYMSPEQLQDEPVTTRSDLFSLGIVAYELCAGVHPFRAKTEYLTSSNIMFEKHTPLITLDPTTPEALSALFDRLLDKQRDNRPASAGEVETELKAIVRQLRFGASDATMPSFGNIDEMTGLMVERIVHWAKGKENAGALVEAIEAYKRAILLAPNVPWLHARVAELEEQLTKAPGLDPVHDEDPALRTSSRNRHRESFIRERMVEADAALDEGELDRASSIAAMILRQYPDEAQALSLMDRIVLITDRGLPVKTYRQALRSAREALAQGDLEGAVRSCDAAVAIWPDDDEVVTLGREIEKVRQVEIAKAFRAADEVLERAAAGGLDDGAAPGAIAPARDALRRAEEMGAPAGLVAEKSGALDRVAREAEARQAKRAQESAQAEQARQAELDRLFADVTRRLAAAERAALADASAAKAALADVQAAEDAIARAESLGAAPSQSAGLAARSAAAKKALSDRISSEEGRVQREREAEEARVKQEREAEAARVKRERDAKERAEREAEERRVRLEREAADAKAQRFRTTLGEARAAFQEADALAPSIATEADRMADPLVRARRLVEGLLAAEPGDPDAKALLGKIQKLAAAADRYAADAERTRREAAQRLEDQKAKRREERAAATKRWLLIGGVAVVVLIAAVVGVSSFREQQRKKNDAAEVLAQQARSEAAAAATQAQKDLEAIGRAVPAIDGEEGRKNALARCDAALASLSKAANGDPANVDVTARARELTKLKERIQALTFRPQAQPQPPPANDFSGQLAEIRSDLAAAGNAPLAPQSAVDDALARADHGIGLAKEVLREHPGDRQARSLLAELQQARTVLQRRHDGLVGQVKPPIPPTPPKPEIKTETKPEAKPEVKPQEPAPAKGVDAAKMREKVDGLQDEAGRQSLTSTSGASGRAALDRQALEALSQAGGQDWARAKKAEIQTDLDTALVWSLFHKYKEALVSRDPDTIRALYPKYPSAKQIAELRAFQYNFEILELNLAAKTVNVRETTHSHHYPNYWDPPHTAVLKYTLDQRPDGNWTIGSGTVLP